MEKSSSLSPSETAAEPEWKSDSKRGIVVAMDLSFWLPIPTRRLQSMMVPWPLVLTSLIRRRNLSTDCPMHPGVSRCRPPTSALRRTTLHVTQLPVFVATPLFRASMYI